MSRGQTLRALVNERLAAAAEDIFVLFERTIAEYEEDLCRSKEENQRNTQISRATGPGLNQEITEIPQIKEEPEERSVKQEEEQLPVSVSEFRIVCIKTEESSLLQQRQTEQGEDISSEPGFHSETEGHTEHSSDTDNDDDRESFSCSAAQMETEADGDHYNQVQTRDRSTKLSPQNKSAPETTVHSESMSGAHRGAAQRKKHECPFCNKTFERKYNLKLHMRAHTGERPYNCPLCTKTFITKGNLEAHKRLHTGDRPFRCSVCEKTFIQKTHLTIHMRKHTGEKPYSCSICGKDFIDGTGLRHHSRFHSGERPYSCSTCGKTFAYKNVLMKHTKTHSTQQTVVQDQGNE